MHRHYRRGLSAIAAMAMAVGVLAAAPAAQASASTGATSADTTTAAANINYPDIQLAAFWNSEEEPSDTLYMSANGSDFQRISVPYQVDGPGHANNGHVTGAPDYVVALHDPGLFYVNGSFWMISGNVEHNKSNPGFYPMLGSSKDLVHWTYPDSGSPGSKNFMPTLDPPKCNKTGQWCTEDGLFDTAGPDAMADGNGAWIVTTLGYYGANHGHAQQDLMQPYILRADNLRAGADQATQPWVHPQVDYGELKPIILPTDRDRKTDWLDPSLYKEGDTYYLSIKKDGITNQIYGIKDLNQASDPNAWWLVNDNVVTGYEGPSLNKYKGRYYMYTDKLRDYPAGSADGTSGVFVTESDDLYKGWGNTHRITTTGVDGRSIPNHHGSVITITDPALKELVFKQREAAGYGAFKADANGNGINGWYTENGRKYWYDEGMRAVSKEVYDPGSDAWYWFDADGTMATNKDVYIPSSDKWVRYDANGHMIKGEDYRYGGWYWFDPTTGAMTKGVVYIPSNGGKWVYYDYVTGKMAHGEAEIHDSVGHNGWYYFDETTGAMLHGFRYVSTNGGKWVYYDYVTGIMQYGLQHIDGAWYYFEQGTGKMAHGNTWVPEWNAWHYFDDVTGRG